MGEFRSAIRALKSTPGPVAAAILTLALAIGMNAGMVGLVDRALLSPPEQVTDPDRLVTLAFERGEGDERARMMTTSYVIYAAVRDHVPAFTGAAAWQRNPTTATIAGDQVRADVMLVSGNYFDVLGAKARFGRPVQADDDRTASAPVVVLSHAFWQSAFAGDAGVLGQRVNVSGLEYAVSGVMAPRFSGHSATNVDMWVPFAAAMRQSPGWDQQPYRRVGSIVARLSGDSTAAAAVAQAGAATSSRVVLTPLGGADVSSTDRRVAWWLTGVSALVLVIGLANAATLLLVRASRRRREFAIRAALGATRARLLLQACIEAALVALVATGASLLLALWFDGAVRQVLLPDVAAGDGAGRTMMLAKYFVPFSQVPIPPFIANPDRGAWGLLLRVDTDVAALAPAIRRIVVGGRVDVPFIRVRPYTQLLDRQMRPWRLGTALLGLFSALALCVGAVGLYAAFSHAVTVRRREMAIRIAIGARPRGVVWMILREAARLAGAGIVAGWIAAVIGGRWLQSLLFDTSRADPLVLGSAATIMLAVAVVATLLPARAASRADPSSLLRAE